jgi:regulator of protease activity HflC (stomatin/prohibitin superfamily)
MDSASSAASAGTLSAPDPRSSAAPVSSSSSEKAHNALSALRLLALLLALALLSNFFVVIHAGERGVLMKFGAVQEQVLPEGLHPLLPVVYSIKTLSVRVQPLEVKTEAATRDLQDLSTDVAVNWHIPPDQVNRVFQRLGDGQAIEATVIRPAVEEVLKAVVASFRAEQIVTERDRIKAAIDALLSQRLDGYGLGLDDVSLLQLGFSERFRDAVEAKQVAVQEAKRAEYQTIKAQRLAEARVFKAKGEAEAHQLLQAGLTPQVLEQQAIEKWNGHLPLVMGNDAAIRGIDFKSLLKVDGRQRR